MERGLDLLRQRRCPFVIVVGHPSYYPRFGFVPASEYGLACQWADVPDEAFMAIILSPQKMAGIHGMTRFRDEWDDAV
jgi:putative acetyltransferase